jgi:hypothetical protein
MSNNAEQFFFGRSKIVSDNTTLQSTIWHTICVLLSNTGCYPIDVSHDECKNVSWSVYALLSAVGFVCVTEFDRIPCSWLLSYSYLSLVIRPWEDEHKCRTVIWLLFTVYGLRVHRCALKVLNLMYRSLSLQWHRPMWCVSWLHHHRWCRRVIVPDRQRSFLNTDTSVSTRVLFTVTTIRAI